MSNILVGVTGGIAAYKTAYLVREFIRARHNVKVVMTKKAESFVGHTTFEALSLNPVLREDKTYKPYRLCFMGRYMHYCTSYCKYYW